MDYIMEAELLNYETQINMLKEAAYNSYIDESLITEEFSIKKAWDSFVKWLKEKVGPIIKKLFNWGKEVVSSEEKKDEKAKEDIDFILKYQNQMKNAYAGNAIEKKKICMYALDMNSEEPVVDIVVTNDTSPIDVHIFGLKRSSFILKTILGMSNEKFEEEKKEHMKKQEEINKLKINDIEKCFYKKEIRDDWLISDAYYITNSMKRIVEDKNGIKDAEKNLSAINDIYYSMQKEVNDFDKKYGGSPDEGVKNTIAYGNMVVKEIIDMGTVIRTCIQLYKKDKDHQYMFLKQVKALMKEALDRGEAVGVPDFV